MFARILVPLNDTPEAAVALAPAQTVAKATGASITLLTVIDTAASEADHTSATAHLERVASELNADGVHVNTLVRQGEPADEIVAATLEGHAELVVMATHGRNGLARAFLGSVSQRVLATSPVLLRLAWC